MTFDFIGDVHGYAEDLRKLLGKLGYREVDGVFRHGEKDRNAVFLGDLIDRGPQIRRTLRIVASMEAAGTARVVMGNHEYNAICFGTRKPGEEHRWMRSRTDKNLRQHIDTLYQFKDYRDEWSEYLRWFHRLPLWLDLGGIRAVHAAWDSRSLALIEGFSPEGNLLTPELLVRATVRGNGEFRAMQNILKGVEVPLPNCETFVDKDGTVRKEMRVRWWLSGGGKTYADLAFPRNDGMPGRPIEKRISERLAGYSDDVPVIFGHYWLKDDLPAVISPKLACLDYSVASGGSLVSYTWSGERELSNTQFTVA